MGSLKVTKGQKVKYLKKLGNVSLNVLHGSLGVTKGQKLKYMKN
jgi:hypothetical protein